MQSYALKTYLGYKILDLLGFTLKIEKRVPYGKFKRCLSVMSVFHSPHKNKSFNMQQQRRKNKKIGKENVEELEEFHQPNDDRRKES